MVEGWWWGCLWKGGGQTWLLSPVWALPLPGPAEERAAPAELGPPGALGLQGAPRAQPLAGGQVHTWEASSEGTRSWASSWILSCSDSDLSSWIRVGAPIP